MKPNLKNAAAAITAFLDALDLPAEALVETQGTGQRVAEAFANDLLSGYRSDPALLFAEVTASDATGLVALNHIPVVLVCPHHLLPSIGVGHVGYLPNASSPRVVGLGALADVLDCFSRRLTLQEDVARQVVEAVVGHTGAAAAACALVLSHGCITCRKERRTTSTAFTIAYAGAHAADPSFRADFWEAVRAEITE